MNDVLIRPKFDRFLLREDRERFLAALVLEAVIIKINEVAFFDAQWRVHKAYRPKMKGKRIGLITLCGDPNVSTADPIVHSFKNTCQFAGLNLLEVVQASAGAKGEIANNEVAKKKAYDLGRKSVSK